MALVGGATGPVLVEAIFGLLIFSFALFFWFADGPQIVRSLMRLSPLEEKYVSELIRDFEVLVRAVVAGSLASAIVQTLLAGLGYWLSGRDSVFLLVGATLLMSMVPFVRAAVIWVPAGLWLIPGEGHLASGVLLLAWGRWLSPSLRLCCCCCCTGNLPKWMPRKRRPLPASHRATDPDADSVQSAASFR